MGLQTKTKEPAGCQRMREIGAWRLGLRNDHYIRQFSLDSLVHIILPVYVFCFCTVSDKSCEDKPGIEAKPLHGCSIEHILQSKHL